MNDSLEVLSVLALKFANLELVEWVDERYLGRDLATPPPILFERGHERK